MLQYGSENNTAKLKKCFTHSYKAEYHHSIRIMTDSIILKQDFGAFNSACNDLEETIFNYFPYLSLFKFTSRDNARRKYLLLCLSYHIDLELSGVSRQLFPQVNHACSGIDFKELR